MRKILIAAAILSVSFALTSCGGGAGADPKVTLLSFFEALGKKDFEAARKLATADSKSMIDLIETGTNMAKDKPGKDMDKFDKTKMEFGDAIVQGDKATVPVKEKSSGDITNFTLKKESGAWKVAFDKSSMMEMGMDKMKQKDPHAMDSLTQHLDELKNLNTDSIKELMNSGMKSLDSIKAVLKEHGH